jgi:hypothetical protein
MTRGRRLANGLRLARLLAITWLVGCAAPTSAVRSGDADEARAGVAPSSQEAGYFATTLGRSEFEMVLVQYWSKGARFRAETIVTGHPIITVVDAGWYYTWDGLTGEGYAIKRDEAAIAADQRRGRPFGMELRELRDQGGTKIQSEELGGVQVDVYRVTDAAGRRTLWIDAEQELPVRLETFSRATGRTGTLDWISWIPGLVIPDAFFQPATDLALIRFESYAAYLDGLARAPIPPAPPLFHYLLQDHLLQDPNAASK